MNVELREWREDDAPALAYNANSPEVASQLRDVFPHPYTLADARFFIGLCKQADPDRELLRAIVADGAVVGGISLMGKEDVNRKCAEIGYWLGKDHWGKGIAGQAVGQMVEMGFARLDIVRIYAEFFDSNRQSQRVLEKNGFTLEGRLRKSVYKNGVFHDSLLYAVLKE